jgi:hypothetical protein
VKAAIAFLPVPASLYIAWDAKDSIPEDFEQFKNDMHYPVLVALVGISIYAAKFPERFSPGTFDLILNHHSFHHIWSLCYGTVTL